MKHFLCTLTGLLFAGSIWAQMPIAAYDFSGNANDNVSNNHGTVYGASLTTDRYGNPNAAYDFDGVDDYITFGDAPTFHFGTGEFAISLWIETSIAGPKGAILGKRNPSMADNYNQYSIWYNNSNGLINTNTYGNMNATHDRVTNTSTINNGWNHIVLVRDNSCDCDILYVNGKEEDRSIQHTDISTYDMAGFPLEIGRRGGANDFYFQGKIDDIKMYPTTLSANAVQDLFYEGGNWQHIILDL